MGWLLDALRVYYVCALLLVVCLDELVVCWCLGELVLLFYVGGFVLNGFDVWWCLDASLLR